MPMTAADILEAARQLSPQQQQWLAQELLDSEQVDSPEEIEAAWAAEVERRIDEIDSGKVQPIPWETAQEHMQALRRELLSK